MRPSNRTLLPLLALFLYGSCQAASSRFLPVTAMRLSKRTPTRRRSQVPAPDRPTEELPRRWDLPEGWRSFVRPLPSGGLVEYVSGSDTDLWARFYSWPFDGRPRHEPQEARKAFDRDFDLLVIHRATHQRKDEFHQTFLGWSSGQPDGPPDILVRVRTGSVGKGVRRRLYAVVVGAREGSVEGDLVRHADAFSERLEVVAPKPLRWGRGGL